MILPPASAPGPEQILTTNPAATPAHPTFALAGKRLPSQFTPASFNTHHTAQQPSYLQDATTELFSDTCFYLILLNVVSKSLRKNVKFTIDTWGLPIQTQSGVGERIYGSIQTIVANLQRKLKTESESNQQEAKYFLGPPFSSISMMNTMLFRCNFILN